MYPVKSIVALKDGTHVTIECPWLDKGFYGTIESGPYYGMSVWCVPWSEVSHLVNTPA